MDTSGQAILDETPNREVRRRRSVEEKRRIVEETLEAGASVARVARRHAVNANQVFYWRKKYREGRLDVAASLIARVVWIESGDAHNGDLSQTLVALNSNALVFGERHVHPDDLAWFLSFGAVLEPPDKAMVALLHAELEDVARSHPPQISSINRLIWLISALQLRLHHRNPQSARNFSRVFD
jgi:hypothetical protein